MSNTMRELVEQTHVKGFALKAVLLHIADTVRDADLQFWRSQSEMAKRLGTDRKTIRRNLRALLKDDFISHVGDKWTVGNRTNVYEINTDTLMSLPCSVERNTRVKLVQKLSDQGRCREPHGEGSRASMEVVERPTNHTVHTYPYSPPRNERLPRSSKYARAKQSTELDDHIAELGARHPEMVAAE